MNYAVKGVLTPFRTHLTRINVEESGQMAPASRREEKTGETEGAAAAEATVPFVAAGRGEESRPQSAAI